MGLFSKEPKKEIQKEKKYCEMISTRKIFLESGYSESPFEKIENIVSDRIKENRIIKDIKMTEGTMFIIYDYEAEERRRQEELEKQNSKDAWTQKLDNDKNNSNGWER